ncbi:MAG: twin-arginine translocation signal domain-containing protein [Anaerolineae bacterium]|nr:twin-arginine translocation signal domain-containing protein [Anaerolineae bacterium]
MGQKRHDTGLVNLGRREFLKQCALAGTGLLAACCVPAPGKQDQDAVSEQETNTNPFQAFAR